MKSHSAFRRMERKVFDGVPEQPEPVWERDTNANVAERATGRSQFSNAVQAAALASAPVVAILRYSADWEETVEFVMDSEHPSATSK